MISKKKYESSGSGGVAACAVGPHTLCLPSGAIAGLWLKFDENCLLEGIEKPLLYPFLKRWMRLSGSKQDDPIHGYSASS